MHIPVTEETACASNDPVVDDPSSDTTAVQSSPAATARTSYSDGRPLPTELCTPDCKSVPHCVHARNRKGWRKIIRNFSPSWFAVTMGTGIVSIILHNLPYNSIWLYWISVVLFALNVFLFCLFSVLSVLRYAIYPNLWIIMVRHPSQSLFLGTFPMGLATIVNMIVFVCVPAWGHIAIHLAWALWWIDVILAITVAFFLPFIIMWVHRPGLSSMTAAWLLPVVTTIVASASGGIVAEVLPDPTQALWTLIVSYALWGIGVPLAMAILIIYFHRLTIHQLPPREAIVSVFLPLGPLGQGGFAILQLGKVAMKVFPRTHTLVTPTINAGDVFYVVGWLIDLIMWGFGLVWLFFAVASISRSRFPFNMGWWGFTFPLGVYATATVSLGMEMPSRFFNALGTALSVAVTLLWILVTTRTLKRVYTGELFVAPCLKEFEGKQAKAALHFGDNNV